MLRNIFIFASVLLSLLVFNNTVLSDGAMSITQIYSLFGDESLFDDQSNSANYEKQGFNNRRSELLLSRYNYLKPIFQGVFNDEQQLEKFIEECIDRHHKANQLHKENSIKIQLNDKVLRMMNNPKMMNTYVMFNGKYLDIADFSNKNLDFTNLPCLNLTVDPDTMSYTDIRNCSFYAANLEGAIFDGVNFINCCFKEANLRNIDALNKNNSCALFHGSDFTGAEISGAKFGSISREQLLSTSNFRQYQNIKRERINLANCTFLRWQTDAPQWQEEKKFDLSDIDFNKFNNGKPTPLPLYAVDVGFGDFKMCNCNFAGATLAKARFYNCNLAGSNFSKAYLVNANFGACTLSKCNFEDAEINNARFILYHNGFLPYSAFPVFSLDEVVKRGYWSIPIPDYIPCMCNSYYKSNPLPAEKSITAVQLKTTANYKRKELLFVSLGFSDLSGVDFSRFNLTGCIFMGNLQNADFTDAVISGCSFGSCCFPNCDIALKTNLTVDQIKSTWNYKTNRMEGITLPPEIQKALDIEKQTTDKK
jgi:uncharacterized protein YjbI with pentapeptide repeats